jgi:hypothetical protein
MLLVLSAFVFSLVVAKVSLEVSEQPGKQFHCNSSSHLLIGGAGRSTLVQFRAPEIKLAQTSPDSMMYKVDSRLI